MCRNRILSFLSIALLFISFATVIAAPGGKIRGVVFDQHSRKPLLAANVYIVGASYGGATDIDGVFLITDVPPGKYQLTVEYLGYNNQTIDVEVKENESTTVEVSLVFQAVDGEVVEVTAQAEGQISAINQQLSSNTITNVVSEARIRELPDVNAAESIGRLPGVSIERSGGEATKVSIRGLSPKYNTVTVNGVRLPATGSDDRSVDLSLISSNVLDGIEVKKAITPDMDADVLGGTVDLKLKEAPAGLRFGASALGGYNQLQDYYGNYNFRANISNRFAEGRLGVIATFNSDEYDRSADKFSGTYRQATTSEGETEIIAQNVGLREENVTRGRTGGSLLLDYKLLAGKIAVNGFYNRLSWETLNRINRLNTSENRHYYELERQGGNTAIFTGGIGIDQDLGWLRLDADYARTASRMEAPREYSWQFRQEAGAFDFGASSITAETHPNEIPAFATNDTALTALADVWIWDTDREENQNSFQMNFEVPFKLGNNINGYFKTGGKFRWLDRANDREQNGRDGLLYGDGGNEMLTHLNNAFPAWGVQDYVDQYNHLPITLFLDDYNRANFLDGEYPLGFTYNEEMLRQVTEVLEDSGDVLNYAIGSLASDYEGIERYQAGYLMAEMNVGRHITLLPGFRYEKDYSEYTGFRFREVSLNNIQGPPADLDTITNIREHEFFLPMIHLQIRPNDKLRIRLAYTESLTRPDFIQYAPITRINVYQSYIRASNSKLRPAHSTNYDAAVSYYENHIGLFTVAGFYKSIDDLIFQTRYNFRLGVPVPDGFNIPETWLTGAAPQADLYINSPFESKYQGFELDWQTHFWYLPSVLSGLVLNVNYTYIDSETTQRLFFTQQDSLIFPRPPVYSYKIVDSTRVARMPDQPKHIANVTLGYDFKGFSARLSYLYQTDKTTFIDREPALDNFSGTYARWDFSMQQKLTGRLGLFANFTNLNQREDENFRGSALEDPTYTEYYGFAMDFGIRLRY